MLFTIFSIHIFHASASGHTPPQYTHDLLTTQYSAENTNHEALCNHIKDHLPPLLPNRTKSEILAQTRLLFDMLHFTTSPTYNDALHVAQRLAHCYDSGFDNDHHGEYHNDKLRNITGNALRIWGNSNFHLDSKTLENFLFLIQVLGERSPSNTLPDPGDTHDIGGFISRLQQHHPTNK